MNKKHIRFGALAAIVLTVTILVAYGAKVGSEENPLVTLSYLEQTYTDELLEQVDSELDKRDTVLREEMEDQVDAVAKELKKTAGSGTAGTVTSVDAFSVVTLTNGQTLNGQIGCEVMLRVGTALCVSPSTPGLVDTTGAGILNHGGGLEKNHLYMMTIEERGVKATADTVKLLVRGEYTIAEPAPVA